MIQPREIKTHVHKDTCTSMSTNRWMDKEIVAYSHNRMILSNKKERSIDIYNSMATFLERKKLDTKKYMFCDSFYINSKKRQN